MTAALLAKINEFGTNFYLSSSESVQKIINVLDNVLLALGIVLFGWILGTWIRNGIVKIGEKVKIVHFSKRIGFTRLLQRANIQSAPEKVVGEFVKGYVITIFLIGASKILGFTQVSEFLDSLISYIPNIIIALLIVLFGIGVADTIKAVVENTLKLPDSTAAKTLALTARYIIITFSIMAALFQLKIAAELVQILFTGFIALITLAGGLAFGLGGKDVIREFLEDLKKHGRS